MSTDTVGQLLSESTAVVVDAAGNQRTAAEISAAGQSLAADFQAAGVEPGDRVAIRMANGPLYLDLLAAAAWGRFTVASINTRFADQLAQSIIERCGAKLVLNGSADLPMTTGRALDDAAPSSGDRYAIFTTSGTTSAPKLVVHQQRSIAAHAHDVASAFGYTPESVVLIPLPMCGVFGFTVFWGAVAGGARIIMPTAFEAEETGRLIQEHGVTSLHGSDDLFHRLLATNYELSSIETAGYARFNSALDGIVERCDERGVPLAGLYGMSEVQALFAFRGAPGRTIEQRWRPAGELVSARAASQVVDDELQLQGPSLFEGYLADGGAEIDHDLTAANFNGDWFKTGDLAVQDGPRSFEYITRIGDVMRLGGFLVAPAEVEGVLMQFDGVDQAQVVAVDQEHGARPVAFVILAPGGELDETAVIAHCQLTLAKFKCPIRVVAVQEFPVTDGPNGIKIQRSKLRQMGSQILGEPRD